MVRVNPFLQLGKVYSKRVHLKNCYSIVLPEGVCTVYYTRLGSFVYY